MSKSQALVLFDIDGTLLRGAGQHHRLALAEGIRRITGRETTLDGIPTSGMLDRDLIVAMLRAAGESERQIRRHLTRIMAECQLAYENCSEDLSPFVCSGVCQMLAQLRDRGAILGLVTGNLSSIGWRKMELAGLRDFFSVGGFAEDGTSRARVALVAVRRARNKGLLARDPKISLVGDHENDIRAARVNGFQSVAVATGLSSREELARAGPDFLISDLTELPVEQLMGS